MPETRPPSPIPHWAFKYGENIGLAFQLIDDWLDFVASADQLGKPAGADLKVGTSLNKSNRMSVCHITDMISLYNVASHTS